MGGALGITTVEVFDGGEDEDPPPPPPPPDGVWAGAEVGVGVGVSVGVGVGVSVGVGVGVSVGGVDGADGMLTVTRRGAGTYGEGRVGE